MFYTYICYIYIYKYVIVLVENSAGINCTMYNHIVILLHNAHLFMPFGSKSIGKLMESKSTG